MKLLISLALLLSIRVEVELPGKQGLKQSNYKLPHHLASNVEVELPGKQGLKPILKKFISILFKVEVELPGKQGLKRLADRIKKAVVHC